ncbi:hypothetical protein BOS5A_10573 [Bosea sp. EC-HK365B]|nr:hypothetical protein BOSE21B_10501 [Bosea sp. 21B]CAD5266080.1 hypothetical protein BOSE7B_150636 [Bosea sp. 7B]VVT44742.1 hypothetical protein BOS5A_10573 [Bosea sp. EC-HK365B]VXC49660.1 hypothetical protein BOSE127_190263 [Bosea sp. 127]
MSSPKCRRPRPARSRSSSCARWRGRCDGARANGPLHDALERACGCSCDHGAGAHGHAGSAGSGPGRIRRTHRELARHLYLRTGQDRADADDRSTGGQHVFRRLPVLPAAREHHRARRLLHGFGPYQERRSVRHRRLRMDQAAGRLHYRRSPRSGRARRHQYVGNRGNAGLWQAVLQIRPDQNDHQAIDRQRLPHRRSRSQLRAAEPWNLSCCRSLRRKAPAPCRHPISCHGVMAPMS